MYGLYIAYAFLILNLFFRVASFLFLFVSFHYYAAVSHNLVFLFLYFLCRFSRFFLCHFSWVFLSYPGFILI